MRLYLTTVAILAHICGPAARADFVLTATTQPAPASGQLVSSSPLVPDSAPHATVRAMMQHLPAPRFAEAKGFGQNVPLDFAVRQIVPPAVKVKYGPGVDPSQNLSWHGDAGWNWVLANAVRPLGLHLVMTYMAVEIAK